MRHGTRTGYSWHGCRCDACRAANNSKNSTRNEQGVIATLTDGQRLRSVHAWGLEHEALLWICDYCDLYGWQIVSLSTPRTISRDLRGRPKQRGAPSLDGTLAPGEKAYKPEESMLGRVRRMDLLASDRFVT